MDFMDATNVCDDANGVKWHVRMGVLIEMPPFL
jgi:hypothetical protein